MAADHPNAKLRIDAIALGLKRYTPIVPCARAHVSERYTRGNACIECQFIKGNEWIIKNPDRSRAIKHRYVDQPEIKAIRKKQSHLWHKENKEIARERCKNYRANNPEKVKSFPSNSPLYPKRILMRELRREKQSEYHKQWKIDNPERVKALTWKREARKRGNGGSHTAEDIKEIFKAQKGKCAYCRIKLKKLYHLDHITALINGGSNDRRNLQILCAPCNLRKNRKDPIDYARSRGMLL